MILFSGIIVLSGGCGSKKKVAAADGSESNVRFEGIFIDACTQFNIGQYNTALKLLNTCQEMKPDEASVYFELSRVYIKLSDKNKAFQNALKANELSPENVTYAILYADQLKSVGNFSEAEKILETCLNAHKDDEQLVKYLDGLYARYPLEKSLEKRIELWQKFRNADGYKLNTSLRLIELYKQNKDLKSAHTVYDEIKQASPGKYKYFIDDADLYLSENDTIHADLNYEKALQINPNNFQLNYALFRRNAYQNNVKKAETFIEQAFMDPFTKADTKLLSCAELYQIASKDTYYLHYLPLVAGTMGKLYPENAHVCITVAKFYKKAGEPVKALTYFKKTIAIDPNMFEAWQESFKCCRELGLHEDRIRLAEQALEYYPTIASVYYEAANASNLLNTPKQTMAYAQSGLSFATEEKDKMALLTEMAVAEFKLEQYKEAKKHIDEAIAINPAESKLYEYLGDVYSKMNESLKATENWKISRDKGNTSPVLSKKINEGKYTE